LQLHCNPFAVQLLTNSNKKNAAVACGVKKSKRFTQHTGAIQGSPSAMKPRAPMQSGELPT
jgi:hypothetical protein